MMTDRLFRHLVLMLAAAMVSMLSLPAAAASNDGTSVYIGTVGKAAVVVELQTSESDVWGRYFYRKHRLDIPLSGTVKGDEVQLAASSTGDALTLRKDARGFAGSMTNNDGKKFPVTLALADPHRDRDEQVSELLPNLDLYDNLQLSGLKLERGAVSTQNGRTLRAFREPVSGISLFRIESGYPTYALVRLNQHLERQHWKEVSAWFSCPGFEGASGMDISEVSASWFSDGYVSYAWSSSWSCAGTAHPDFGTQGHSYDARTGRELDLDDILPIGDAPIPARDSDAWYAYRSEVFGPAVVKLLRKLHPGDMPVEAARPSDDSDECDYGDPEVWNFPSWYLTKDGLYLGAIFARVNRACDSPEWSVIPWSELPAHARAMTMASTVQGSALWFGGEAFTASDIKSLNIDFDSNGFAVLDIAFDGAAVARLAEVTQRFQNTDVTIKLDDETLSTARLVEPIPGGRIRISGRFSVRELDEMAQNIVRTLKLPKSAFASPSR